MNGFVKGFRDYIAVEKALSVATVGAYVGDVRHFLSYLKENEDGVLSVEQINQEHIAEYINKLVRIGMAISSQARIISSIRSFFDYLITEDMIGYNPTELISTPKSSRSLPDVLSVNEIEQIIQAIDLSTKQGLRTRAIVEVLYACGLRVSELTSLQLTHIDWEEEIIQVIGKGNKERLVPISGIALKHVRYYIDGARAKSEEDQKTTVLFLNHRGNPLSRISVFLIIKKLIADAQIPKRVSPHSFRHALATHLLEGGADLRAVQQILGHEHITTTEIYTHLDKRYLRKMLYTCHPQYRSASRGSI